MTEWFRNYGVTFTVEAETEEQAEELLDAIAVEEMGKSLFRDAWAGDIEAIN